MNLKRRSPESKQGFLDALEFIYAWTLKYPDKTFDDLQQFIDEGKELFPKTEFVCDIIDGSASVYDSEKEDLLLQHFR